MRKQITKKEKVVRFVKHIARYITGINRAENRTLTAELFRCTRLLKERNSEIVFNNYYMPIAIKEILKKDGYLTNGPVAVALASSYMLKDLANGVLDEFYRFKEVTNE